MKDVMDRKSAMEIGCRISDSRKRGPQFFHQVKCMKCLAVLCIFLTLSGFNIPALASTPVSVQKSGVGPTISNRIETDLPDYDDGFLQVSVVDNPGKELFNNLERTTRTVRISGYSVVLDATGIDKGRLYERFNDRPDIKYVYIYADTLVVKGTLKLPGTDVWIYARQMYFIDVTGQRACIITTPHSDWLLPGAGENGRPGQRAGNVLLALSETPHFSGGQPDDKDEVAPRIIAKGGNGQSAGPGAQGKDGPVLPDCSGELERLIKDKKWKIVSGAVPTGVVYYEQLKDSSSKPTLTTAKWPGNGGDAQAAGRPGSGGSGGNVYTSFKSPNGFAESNGGEPGKQGKKETGGSPGKPSPATWVTYSVKGSKVALKTASTHTGNPGREALPGELTSKGREGVLIANIDSHDWLRGELASPVLGHIEDTYLSEDYAKAERVVNTYINAFSESKPADDATRNFLTELQSLQSRLSGNEDYFGNPRNWVPRLSLRACELALEREIDNAIPTITMARKLEAKKASYDVMMRSSNHSLKTVMADLNESRSGYDHCRLQNTELANESAGVTAKLDALKSELQNRVDELTAQAKNDIDKKNSVALWRQALQVLGTIAKASPIYTPVTGTLGGGLTTLSKIGAEDGLSVASGLAGSLSGFTQDSFNQGALQFETQLNGVDFSNPADVKDKAINLMQMAKGLNDQYAQLKKSFTASQSDSSAAKTKLKEIQDKLIQIEGKDTAFKTLNAKVNELKSQQDALAKKISETSLKLGKTTQQIAEDLAAIDALNARLNSGIDQFDPYTYEYVEKSARSQQERLYRYQYYLARAYYYQKLAQYPLQLGINRILERLSNQVNDTAALSQSDIDSLKRLYKEQIRDIVGGDVDQMQTQGVEATHVLFYSLSADELNRLNQSGEVEINLPGTQTEPTNNSQAAGETSVQPASTATDTDNRRITQLGIAGSNDIQIEDTGSQPVSPTSLQLTVYHSDRSEFDIDGRKVWFTHKRNSGDPGIKWDITYDVAQFKVYESTPDDGDTSLFDGMPATEARAGRMMIHPSVEGPLKITVKGMAPGLKLDKLRLYVKYEAPTCCTISTM